MRWVEAVREEGILKDPQELRIKAPQCGLRPLRRERCPSMVPLEDGFGGAGSGGARRHWRIGPAASARETADVQAASAATINKRSESFLLPSISLLHPIGRMGRKPADKCGVPFVL